MALSLTSLMSNMRSVSERNMNYSPDENTKTKFMKKRPVKKVTEMGKLGPEIPLHKVSRYYNCLKISKSGTLGVTLVFKLW